MKGKEGKERGRENEDIIVQGKEEKGWKKKRVKGRGRNEEKEMKKRVEDINNWTWRGRKGMEGDGRERQGKGK